jgi:hypothetical protein
MKVRFCPSDVVGLNGSPSLDAARLDAAKCR